MKKKSITKKVRDNNLPEELLEKIRVTPEKTQIVLDKLKYTITSRPEGKTPRGKLWCPYCADFKVFGKSKKTPLSDYVRCESCNISTEDFYVRNENKLWAKD